MISKILKIDASFKISFMGDSGSGKSQAIYNLVDPNISKLVAHNIGIVETSVHTVKTGISYYGDKISLGVVTRDFPIDIISQNIKNIIKEKVVNSYINGDLDDENFTLFNNIKNEILYPQKTKAYDFSSASEFIDINKEIKNLIDACITLLENNIEDLYKQKNKERKNNGEKLLKKTIFFEDSLEEYVSNSDTFKSLLEKFKCLSNFYKNEIDILGFPKYQGTNDYFIEVNSYEYEKLIPIMERIYKKDMVAIIDYIFIIVPANPKLINLYENNKDKYLLNKGDLIFTIVDTKGHGLNKSNSKIDDEYDNISDLLNKLIINKTNYIMFFKKAEGEYNNIYELKEKVLSNSALKKIPKDLIITKIDKYLDDKNRNISQLNPNLADSKVKEEALHQMKKDFENLEKEFKNHKSYSEVLYTSMVEVEEKYEGFTIYKQDEFFNLILKNLFNFWKDFDKIVVDQKFTINNSICSISDSEFNIYIKDFINIFSNNKHNILLKYKGIRPHWNSVSCLRDKIRYNDGHTTNSIVYDNFDIYISKKISNYLNKDKILNCVKINCNQFDINDINKFNNLLKNNFSISELSYRLSYQSLKQEYNQIGYLGYYKDIFNETLNLYDKNLNNIGYVNSTIKDYILYLVSITINQIIIYK